MSSAPPPPPPAGPPPGPPPNPGGGAPPPPSAGSEWDLGTAISYGWNKFSANVAQIILAALVLVVGIIVLAVIGGVLVGLVTTSGGVECTTVNGFTECEASGGTPFILGMILNLLVGAVIFVYAQIVGAGLIRGALGITEGRDFQFAEVFKTDKIGPVILTSLIVGALTFVGFILCYIPGLIIAFLTTYSLYFVLDQDLAPVDAVKASVNLVRENLGQTLIWYLVGGLIAAAGAFACGVGMLVTVPLVLIGTAWTYKILTRQPVAA